MLKSALSLEVLARSISADRNFAAAATSFIESYVSWRRAQNGFNKVISSSARRRIAKSILCLHFGNATHNPDDGATFERLLALCNPCESLDKSENCGPRVLRTVIALAQRSGHLSVQQGWYDRRLKILRPTEKWVDQEADRHEAALANLALLEAHGVGAIARPRGAALVGRLAVLAGRTPLAGLALGEADGPLAQVAALDGGLATALAVSDAWTQGKRMPSHKEIGAGFRLSASQARKVLRLANDNGLIAFGRDGKIADASELTAACRRLVAHEFALYVRCLVPLGIAAPATAVAFAPRAETLANHAH